MKLSVATFTCAWSTISFCCSSYRSTSLPLSLPFISTSLPCSLSSSPCKTGNSFLSVSKPSFLRPASTSSVLLVDTVTAPMEVSALNSGEKYLEMTSRTCSRVTPYGWVDQLYSMSGVSEQNMGAYRKAL